MPETNYFLGTISSDFVYLLTFQSIDFVNPNFIPDAVKILLLGPGVAYMIKLYTAKAKINSHVITIINL